MEEKNLTADELGELNAKPKDQWTEEEKQNFLATANDFLRTGVYNLETLGKYNELRDFLEFSTLED